MNDRLHALPVLKRSLLALLAACALAGCGIMPDRSSIRTAAADARPGENQSLVRGRIRIVVDGQDHVHGLLDRPAMLLFHRGQGRMMATPEADREGRFAWTLPAGDYGVALLRGGPPPTQSPMLMPGGALAMVHGLVDPGIEFVVEPAMTHELGTLVVEIESKRARDILGQPKVFARLLALRVEPAPVPAAGAASSPFRVITRPSVRRPRPDTQSADLLESARTAIEVAREGVDSRP